MKPYIAQRRIDHNNQVFEENEEIELDASAAKPLLAIGAVIEKPVEIPAHKKPGESGSETAGADETGGGNPAPGATEESANANADANAASNDASKTEKAAASKTVSTKTAKTK